MDTKISLVTGGAKSGKSVFAERLLASFAGTKAYIATAEAGDDEMLQRICRHRRRRPSDWQTFEVPQGLAARLESILQQYDAVLIDCLTLYFSNFMLQRPQLSFADLMEQVGQELDSLFRIMERTEGKQVIFVTNEIGSGIVPMAKISREYRDLLGMVNQTVRAKADYVYWTVCGIATELKERQVRLPEAASRSCGDGTA